MDDQTARLRSESARELHNVGYPRRPISGLVYSQIWRFASLRLLESADFRIHKSVVSRIGESGDLRIETDGVPEIDAACGRSRLQAFAQANGLNALQGKFLDRVLDKWLGNVTAVRYGRMMRYHRQTATGDIDQLIRLGILAGNQAGGRSAS